MESGNEDIGSSMQRIGSSLLHVAGERDHMDELEPTTNNLPGDAYDTSPGDFANLIKIFVKAELIHLECYYLEIHLYQLFFELVCSTDIV